MIKEINADTYAERIVGMMADYKATMFDALLWDFESFCGLHGPEAIYNVDGMKALERKFRVYLVKNGIVNSNDEDFYADVFMGRKSNMELNKNAEEKNE